MPILLFHFIYIFLFFFFFNDTATTEIYTLSLHDALPIYAATAPSARPTTYAPGPGIAACSDPRSEEHTSELQSQFHLVCRLLLEKKKKKNCQCEVFFTITLMWRGIELSVY